LKITIASEVPASFSVGGTDRTVAWSRWAGWLSTCPVLLIHLSNLAGKEVFNARRMMKMLIAFQTLIMCGVTASMIENDWKYAFYLGGCAALTPTTLPSDTPQPGGGHVSLSSRVRGRHNGAVSVCAEWGVVTYRLHAFGCSFSIPLGPSRSALADGAHRDGSHDVRQNLDDQHHLQVRGGDFP
jgi:hypothetical protein